MDLVLVIVDIDQNLNKYSKQPLLTLSNKDELPEILRETFEFYNKFTRKEYKKTTTQAEKDILFDCVFKMRCIYGGMINQRYMNLNKQYHVSITLLLKRTNKAHHFVIKISI